MPVDAKARMKVHRGDLALASQPRLSEQPEQYTALHYDYSLVKEEHREIVQKAALEIRQRLRRTVEDMILSGHRLIMVKAMMPGEFTRWLDAEFAMSISTANEFMNVAKRFEEFSTIIVEMGVTVVRMLAAPSVPDEAITAVIEQVKMSGKAVKVREARAIVRSYLPPKAPKPKQLPPEPEPGPTIEAEYSVIPDAEEMPQDLLDAGYRLIDTMPGPGWRWACHEGKHKISGPYQSVALTPEAAIEDARRHFEHHGLVDYESSQPDKITLTLPLSMFRKLHAAALRNQKLWDVFSSEELDRLNIIFSKALKGNRDEQ